MMNQLNNTYLSSVTNNITQPHDTSNQKYHPAEINYQEAQPKHIVVDENREITSSQPISADVTTLDDTLINLSQLEDKDLLSKVAISKLRRQNEDLREQLKDLSSKLTEVLDKSKSKQKIKSEKPQEFKEDILAKEIENSKQQIGQYKKEIQQLKNRLEICSSEDRISKLEGILKQREQMLQDLAIENKNLQKINREQEKEIDAYYKDQGFEHKVNACSGEVTALREKMRDVQEVSRVNEKNFKKQQEYLTNLNHQYALVCEKMGVPTAFTFSKPEELEDYLERKAKGILPQIDPNNKEATAHHPQSIEPTKVLDSKRIKELEESIKDLRNKEDILQRQLQSLDKKNLLVLTKLKNEVTDIQNKCKDTEVKLREKEQGITGLDKRVVELKQVAKKNALSMLDPGKPIESEPNQATSTRNLRDNKSPGLDNRSPGLDNKLSAPILKTVNKLEPQQPAKEKDVVVNKPLPKPVEAKEVPKVRDVLGGRTGVGLFEFSDKDVFENLFSTKIVKLTVWLGETYINGIQASYKVDNAEDVVGNQHLAAEMKGKTRVVESLQIDPDDRISFIAGKYSEGLVSLKFQTAKGKIKVFGDDKNQGEDFEIDMESGEQPTLLFGALCKLKDTKGKEEIVLANVGFTLLKKVKQ